MKQLLEEKLMTFESISMCLIKYLENTLNIIQQKWITHRQKIRMLRRKKKWLEKLG